jgi:signal peptidase
MEAVWEEAVHVRRLGAATSARTFRLAGWALFAASVAAWALFLRPAALGGPATYVIVSGHSMEPALHTGDLVVARRQSTYRRGDVIAYHIMKNRAGAGALVIHRIIGGSSQDGYVTRGDNRSYRDPWRPKPADIAGTMQLHVPRLGLLPVYAHSALGMALISALAGFLVLRGGNGARDPRAAPPASQELTDSVPQANAAPAAVTQQPEPPADDFPPPPSQETAGHLLFAWSPAGYELLERYGEPPAEGAILDVNERLYRVSKLACSPLPADHRPCAYLDAA